MPRTGTTFLYYTLSKHPSVFVPYRKESHYFSVNYHKGEDWFCSLYEDMPGKMLAADINPVYYLDSNAISRLIEFDSGVRVVLGVREPVDFAVSLYTNMVTQGYPVESITKVAKRYSWPLSPIASVEFSLADGFMQRRIEELRTAFGNNLLLYDFRLFKSSPLTVLQAMESFLGVPSFFNAETFDNIRINASGRRTSSLLNALITNQRVLDTLYGITPRSVIRSARSLFERMSASDGPRGSVVSPVSPAEKDALRELLASDVEYYDRLLTPHAIQLGSGTPVNVENGPLAAHSQT